MLLSCTFVIPVYKADHNYLPRPFRSVLSPRKAAMQCSHYGEIHLYITPTEQASVGPLLLSELCDLPQSSCHSTCYDCLLQTLPTGNKCRSRNGSQGTSPRSKRLLIIYMTAQTISSKFCHCSLISAMFVRTVCVFCIQALRNSSGCVSEGVLWWKGEGLHDNPVHASETEWAESAYITAMRAITHGK